MASFHEVLFPPDIALHARGGPERRTRIVTAGSGREERNQRWAYSRRRYDAGYGVKSIAAISVVLGFFEERRGMLHGFRWRDRMDCTSSPINAAAGMLDQTIGTGDGERRAFQLVKTYGDLSPYVRPIAKPVAGSLLVAAGGISKLEGIHFNVDTTTGVVTFLPGHAPPSGASVTAGYRFDVPVRFDTDYLEVDLAAFEAGEIPKIPIVEIQP
jgi:uncharacterized protein (TIGR02217 family)